MRRLFVVMFFCSLLFATACASSRGDDVDQAARLVGRENDVRIDALISNLSIGAGSNVSITYDVENLRSEPIAIAEIVPEVTFDEESGLITVLLGSEVPGNQFLPRLELVRSGEKKSFSTGASLNVGSTVRAVPRSVRIRLSYLKSVEPFESLVGISQKAVHDPALADEMFLPWVENVQFVDTNDVPLQWTDRRRDDLSSTNRAPRRGGPF